MPDGFLPIKETTMRCIIFSALAMICGAAGAQLVSSPQLAPLQATLRVPDATRDIWVSPAIAKCKMYNNLGKLHINAQGLPRVATGYMAKSHQGGDSTVPPQHGTSVHTGTSNHAQTQRIAAKTQSSVQPGSTEVLIRLDATELAAKMAKHHEAEGQAFRPETYRFQVFNAKPSSVTRELVAASSSFDLPAAELASGRLTLLASRDSSTPQVPTWVVAIRAIAANHRYESPQLVCTLRP
jgi:hypothetical protein